MNAIEILINKPMLQSTYGREGLEMFLNRGSFVLESRVNKLIVT